MPAPTNGLVLFYNMSTLSGSNMDDLSDTGNDATISGAASASGQVGNARDFDGIDDYVATVFALNLTGTNAITITFWLYWDAFSANDDLSMESSVNAGANAGAFFIDPNQSSGVRILLRGNVGNSSAEYAQPSGAAWHHWAVVLDMSKATNEVDAFYIDNDLKTPSGRAFNSNNTGMFGNYTLYLMSRAGTSLFGAGVLDEVRIYNRALSASEISDIYNDTTQYPVSGAVGVDLRPIHLGQRKVMHYSRRSLAEIRSGAY